jgi:hypothetical protein
MKIAGLCSRTADELVKLSERVSDICHTDELRFECDFRDLTGKTLEDLKSDIAQKVGSSCLSIYQFRVSENTALDQLGSLITQARKTNLDGRAFARVNTKRDGDPYSLYIGSSRKTGQRLAEHLGLGNAKTYSLQLSHWVTPLEGRLIIEVYRFEPTKDNLDFVPTLEDQLSFELKPFLGRRGRL